MNNELQGQLTADLIKAKLEIGNILKNKTGRKGNLSFNYATLEEILEAIETPLANYNMEIGINMDFHENGTEIVICKLNHTNGATRISRCYLNAAPEADTKETGATFTSRGRHLLNKMLGLKIFEDEEPTSYKNNYQSNTQSSEDTFAKVTPEIVAKLNSYTPEFQGKIKTFNKIDKFEDMTMKQYNVMVASWNKKS